MFAMSCVTAGAGTFSVLLNWVIEHIDEAKIVTAYEKGTIGWQGEIVDVSFITIGGAASIAIFTDLYMLRCPLFFMSRSSAMCVLLFSF